jgi:hypothetical protein
MNYELSEFHLTCRAKQEHDDIIAASGAGGRISCHHLAVINRESGGTE